MCMCCTYDKLSGVNAVNYYAPRIFKMIFGDSSALVPLAGTIGVGVVNLVFRVAAFFLIDRFGRKPLLVSGCAVMAAMHALVAWQVSLGDACTPWLAMAGVYGFIAAVAWRLWPCRLPRWLRWALSSWGCGYPWDARR